MLTEFLLLHPDWTRHVSVGRLTIWRHAQPNLPVSLIIRWKHCPGFDDVQGAASILTCSLDNVSSYCAARFFNVCSFTWILWTDLSSSKIKRNVSYLVHTLHIFVHIIFWFHVLYRDLMTYNYDQWQALFGKNLATQTIKAGQKNERRS